MWVTYKEKLKHLSARLVELQRPIRLLDAVKWDPKVFEDLKKSKYKELPKVDVETYEKNSLGFQPEQKLAELADLQKEMETEIGSEDSLAKILIESCREYQDLVRMLLVRGKPEFYEFSKRLYGSPKDVFFGSKATVKDLGLHLYNILSTADDSTLGDSRAEFVDAHTAVADLNERFSQYFPGENVRVLAENEMLADASASARTIKLKESTKFMKRDVDILEVHEGWAHMGTTINGYEQKIAKWLYKGPPRVSATQEGLAILMEIFSFVSSPKRARKINDRVLAIDKAEDGADFLEVLEYFRTEGYEEDDSLIATQRVFRGGLVGGGHPFTKDISYCKGFVENYNFIRACIQAGKSEMVPFLFVGKVNVQDIPAIYHKYKEGIIDPPKYLPPVFRDLNSLVVWMSFLNFLSAADMSSAQDAYRQLITNS